MKIENTYDIGERESVLLEDEEFRILINRDKGMIPELGTKKGDAWINAHWQPWFRNTGLVSWDEKKHGDYWKVPLLFDMAGSFPCCPNFGPGHVKDGIDLPPHGYTSFLTWSLPSLKRREDSISAHWSLNPQNHPLKYEKTDLLRKGEKVHYTRLEVTNTSDHPEAINCGWHNTVGAPFLESGCLICNNAEQFATPPLGGEFDDTGRFSPGMEFDSLTRVPLRKGGFTDASVVPGIIGYTDFITAAVPSHSEFGWTAIVNPRQKLVYFSWFAGPANLKGMEIPLNFYNYWMNFGGRSFKPWAASDGGTDRSYCLGAENSLGYFANGLDQSVRHPVLLGKPTHLELKGGEKRFQNYGTSFFSYEGTVLDRGISDVEFSEDKIILKSHGGEHHILRAQTFFEDLNI